MTDTGAKGPTKTGKGPIRGGTDKIVLQPDKMRSVAAFLDRTSNTLERDATLLKTQASKPAMPPHVRTNVLAEIAGVQFRMRTLWREAETWSDELKKRANRVDEPAGSRSKRPGHAKVQRKPVLARGATGAMVKTLQRLLNKLGFGPLDVDGIFGPLTQAAVTRFQQREEARGGRRRQPEGLGRAARGAVAADQGRRASRHRARPPRAWAPSS